MKLRQSFRFSLFFVLPVLMVGCGSDSDQNMSWLDPNGNTKTPPKVVTPTPTPKPLWVAGQFLDESQYKDYCQAPRSGTDQYTGQPFPDKAGDSLQEKLWLRSWSNNTYLWYSEITDNNPDNFTSVISYFDQLKTTQRTPSNALKDNFHFTQSTEDYNQLAQGGVASGYGIEWAFGSSTVPRTLRVAYTQDNSPAALRGVKRGYELTKVNDIDFVNATSQAEIDTINAAVFPSDAGQNYRFTFVDVNNENSEHVIELTSANVEVTPVQGVSIIDGENSKIGYMQFNSFISTAQVGLVNAFTRFRNENITDLVIDLRYNGGGLLAMSSQVAYMVAGSGATNGLTFETTQFNDKHPTIDPVTKNVIQDIPFYDKEINWSEGVLGNALPSINLPRVFVLTTDRTCSASEALINGLRGIDIDVVQIGGTTCGKPYGFYPQDNCGTTYFTIQFKGVNNKGFGEYSDGFSPKMAPQFDSEVKGCTVADDFTHGLGDENEALLSAAIHYAEEGYCLPTAEPSPAGVNKQHKGTGTAIKTFDPRIESFLFENKIYQPLPLTN